MRRAWVLVAALTFAAGAARGQTAYITASAENVILQVGESVQVTAIGRNNEGRPSPLPGITWRSRNADVLGVSASGMVTALSAGVGTIAISSGSARGEIHFQAVPKRIDVFGPAGTMVAGETYAFRAVALDVNGRPIPNVRFEWTVSAVDGYLTDVATIDQSGNLKTVYWGAVRIEATLSFRSAPGRLIDEIRGSLGVEIVPNRRFDYVPLVSTGDEYRAHSLRAGLEGVLAANDLGQVAFGGSLDGVAGGVLVHDNGVTTVSLPGGAPTPLRGGVISAFQQPALNNQGMLAIGASGTGRGALFYGPPDQLSFVVSEGEDPSGFGPICCIQTFRDGMQSDGDVLFSASFNGSGEQNGEGLFVYSPSNRSVSLRFTTRRALGDGSRITGISEAGWGDGDTIYLFADWGPSQAVFRLDPGAALPVRLASVGDAWKGSAILGFWTLAVSRDGEAGWGAWINNRSAEVFRHRNAETTSVEVGAGYSVLGVHRDQGVVFVAETYPDAKAVYRWNGAQPQRLLSAGDSLFDGSRVRDFGAGAVTANGKIFVRAETSQRAMAVVAVAGDKRIVVGDGDPAPTTANVFLQDSSLPLAPGGGDPVVLLGDPQNLFKVSTAGLQPLLVVGDRLPAGAIFSRPSGWPSVYLDATGDPYFSVCGQGPHRVHNGVVENLLGGPNIDLPGTDYATLACNTAVSPSGDYLVFDVWTSASDTRLYLKGPQGLTQLAAFDNMGGGTTLPGVGRIFGWSNTAVDNGGRVMTDFRGNGGPGGLYLWENGAWRATILRDQTVVRGGVLRGIWGPTAAADRFHAVLLGGCCDNTYGEYVDGQWRSLLEPDEARPPQEDGIFMSGSFDVNSRGEILFAYYGRSGATLALYAGGMSQIVAERLSLVDQGIILDSFGTIDLREDGTFYFQTVDINDVSTIYHAVPRGQGPQQPPPQPSAPARGAPIRSRSRAAGPGL